MEAHGLGELGVKLRPAVLHRGLRVHLRGEAHHLRHGSHLGPRNVRLAPKLGPAALRAVRGAPGGPPVLPPRRGHGRRHAPLRLHGRRRPGLVLRPRGHHSQVVLGRALRVPLDHLAQRRVRRHPDLAAPLAPAPAEPELLRGLLRREGQELRLRVRAAHPPPRRRRARLGLQEGAVGPVLRLRLRLRLGRRPAPPQFLLRHRRG
mmetsp:Transcript_14681/g.46193  ORF Transcript_14681/g.46193 Transcript_14681/m.46193 type:complete len:205 (-) Transcript_14681:424-1038(-)